jgi:hypothetical protein
MHQRRNPDFDDPLRWRFGLLRKLQSIAKVALGRFDAIWLWHVTHASAAPAVSSFLLIEDAWDQRLARWEQTRTTGSCTLRRELPRSSVEPPLLWRLRSPIDAR